MANVLSRPDQLAVLNLLVEGASLRSIVIRRCAVNTPRAIVSAPMDLATSATMIVLCASARVPKGAGNATSTLPWYSTVDKIDIQLTVPPAYLNTVSGAPNAAWWSAVGQAAQVLDSILPSWITWTFFIQSSHATNCFYLDEPNLDLEIFCT